MKRQIMLNRNKQMKLNANQGTRRRFVSSVARINYKLHAHKASSIAFDRCNWPHQSSDTFIPRGQTADINNVSFVHSGSITRSIVKLSSGIMSGHGRKRSQFSRQHCRSHALVIHVKYSYVVSANTD